MRILIVGHGRMGRLVESLSTEYRCEVAGIATRTGAGDWPAADVAIDFSTADAMPSNVSRYAERGLNAVIGTTGWGPAEAAAREVAERAGIGIVAAPNFAVGVHLFAAIAEYAGRLMKEQPSFGAWIHELHHAEKKDAPSGTALHLERALRAGGLDRPIDVASTRAGLIPGTHTIGFDGAGETLTFTHTARDRSPFARGALTAARWVQGRRGWYGMGDVVRSW